MRSLQSFQKSPKKKRKKIVKGEEESVETKKKDIVREKGKVIKDEEKSEKVCLGSTLVNNIEILFQTIS